MRWEGLLACERCMRRRVLHVSFTAAGTKVEVHKQYISKSTEVRSILKRTSCSIFKMLKSRLKPQLEKKNIYKQVSQLIVCAHATRGLFKCWHGMIQRDNTCFHQRSHLLWCHCRLPQLEATETEGKVSDVLKNV